MTDQPQNSAELVSKVLDSTQRLARRGHRMTGSIILVLLIAVGVLGYDHFSQSSTITRQQTSYAALQKKSAEQTVAEVELRDDVNTLTATNKTFTHNHAESVRLFCSILSAVHDKSAAYKQYCPVP